MNEYEGDALLARAEAAMERLRPGIEARKAYVRTRANMRRHMIERWTHRGLLCGITLSPAGSSFNGYVRIPRGLWDLYEYYDSMPLAVHGSLTYGPDSGRWIGFDTGHAWDYWPWKELRSQLPRQSIPRARYVWEQLNHITPAGLVYGRLWSLRALREETNQLAEEVTALAQGSKNPTTDEAGQSGE